MPSIPGRSWTARAAARLPARAGGARPLREMEGGARSRRARAGAWVLGKGRLEGAVGAPVPAEGGSDSGERVRRRAVVEQQAVWRVEERVRGEPLVEPLGA